MDHQTALGKRPAFARVLVEIGVEDTSPDSINIGCEGNVFTEAVVYACKSKACINCRTFNHSAGSCPHQQEKIAAEVKANDRLKKGRKSKNNNSEFKKPENEKVRNVAAQDTLHSNSPEIVASIAKQGDKIRERQKKNGEPNRRSASPRQHSKPHSNQDDLQHQNSFEVLGNLDGNDDVSDEELERINLQVMKELHMDKVNPPQREPSTVSCCPHSKNQP